MIKQGVGERRGIYRDRAERNSGEHNRHVMKISCIPNFSPGNADYATDTDSNET
jgi:hypothetical protein